MKMLKPRPLEVGAKVGVIAPAGVVDTERLLCGVRAIEAEGLRVELAEGLLERKGYLAGSGGQRARSIEEFFVRDDIRAIFCARGGFGSIQTLPHLNSRLIRSHPKIFVGYSDVTVLLNWLLQECGMAVFHGPMVAVELATGLGKPGRALFWNTLMGVDQVWQIQGRTTVYSGGHAVRAPVVGGCLSMIVTTLATPYEIHARGKILFLEDVGEKPYRIERMLTQLKMAGKLDGLAGVVCGAFRDCEDEEGPTVTEVFKGVFDGSYPVVTGFSVGHSETNLLLPLGIEAEFDGMARTVRLTEPATVDSE